MLWERPFNCFNYTVISTVRHRAQAEFCRGEGGKARTAAHAGSGAGEQDGAMAARHHTARRLAADPKADHSEFLPMLKDMRVWLLAVPGLLAAGGLLVGCAQPQPTITVLAGARAVSVPAQSSCTIQPTGKRPTCRKEAQGAVMISERVCRYGADAVVESCGISREKASTTSSVASVAIDTSI